MSFFTLIKIWDGTNTATVKAASTAAIATDTALVVAISPNNSIAIAGSDADNATNSIKKLPVIAATANAANPAWTEAHEAPLSVDLSGHLRTIGTATGTDADNATNSTSKVPVIAAVANAANPAWTEAHEAPLSVDLSGHLRTIDTQGPAAVASAPWIMSPGSPINPAWTQTVINVSAAGATTIVAGTAAKTTKVMRMFFVNNGAIGITSTQITIQDTTPTAFTGAFTLTTTGVFNAMGNGEPYFTSASGAGIQINSSAAVQISGAIWTEAN